jgi:hypothetical protein
MGVHALPAILLGFYDKNQSTRLRLLAAGGKAGFKVEAC